jgi:uncharacterized protein (DUF2062 family)
MPEETPELPETPEVPEVAPVVVSNSPQLNTDVILATAVLAVVAAAAGYLGTEAVKSMHLKLAAIRAKQASKAPKQDPDINEQ